jgi:hypothetical protein
MLEKTWEYDDRAWYFEVPEFQAKPTISNDTPWKHIFELGRYLTHLDPLSLGAVGSQMGSLMDTHHWVFSRCANFPRGLRNGSLWTLWLWWGEGSHPISCWWDSDMKCESMFNPNLWLKSCAVCLWYAYDMFMICLWYVYDMFVICLWYVYDMFVICLWYVCDMFMICLWLVGRICKLLLKSPWELVFVWGWSYQACLLCQDSPYPLHVQSEEAAKIYTYSSWHTYQVKPTLKLSIDTDTN